MKNTIIAIVVIALVFIGAGVGGYFYFQSQIETLETKNAELQTGLTTVQSQSAAQTQELQTISEAQKSEMENVATYKALSEMVMALSGKEEPSSQTQSGATDEATASGSIDLTSSGATSTGTGEVIDSLAELSTLTPITETLDNSLALFYSPELHIEGPISADSFAAYEKKLKVALTLENNKNKITGYPVELSDGEWTVVTSVKDVFTDIPVKIELSATGSLVPAAPQTRTAKSQEINLALTKWSNGVIVEQYDFEYPGAVSASKLLEYIK
ncbi:hypothetical protein GW846_00900 [Candidatus Gracilibacteria bacterium]|nr:hypothetical protein [Candidatus Gracilibacteria bacterium]